MWPVRHAARRRRWLLALGAVVSVSALLSSCTGSPQASTTDSVDYALPANFQPNWILPIGTAGRLNTNNSSISMALWEPLIAYDGSTGEVRWNKDASVATDVQFAADGKSVTVTLGERHWSDGKPITTRDVEFWYNLIKANKDRWAGYSPGQAPDNWTSLKVEDDRTFTLTFDKAYNTEWMLANQLSHITPLPQHLWGRTDDSAEVSDADRTPDGAKQIWEYLNTAAERIGDYDKNPLWKTVSGPYRLKSFATSGKVSLTANKKYDGGDEADIATVNLLPFTTSEAEKNALRAGQLDYGYIDVTDLEQKESFTNLGYQVKPWSGWAVTYMPLNFNNPDMGPVFQQLYARQAIQHSINQKQLVEVIFNGTAVPGYGPIPQGQNSDFLSQTQKENPYPFSTDKARRLLTGHGWTEQGGVMVCTDPGTSDSQCGKGIGKGTKFEIKLLSQSGSTVTDNMMSAIRSSLAESGINLSIKTAPVNSVLSQTPQCTPDQEICDWQLSYFGTAGSWYFPAYPTGDALFQSNGGSNFGSYSNPEVDKLIDATTTSDDPEAMQEYSAALAEDLPVIWLPEPVYQVSVIKKGLGGFAQDSLANFHPAQWKWTE